MREQGIRLHEYIFRAVVKLPTNPAESDWSSGRLNYTAGPKASSFPAASTGTWRQQVEH